MAEQSLELSRELGDPFRTGWAAHLVGLIRHRHGRAEEAPAYLREALDIFRGTGDESGTLLMLVDVAALAEARGDPEQQWRHIGAAARARDDTGVNLVDELTTADFLGVHIRVVPETDEESAWLEAGRCPDRTRRPSGPPRTTWRATPLRRRPLGMAAPGQGTSPRRPLLDRCTNESTVDP